MYVCTLKNLKHINIKAVSSPLQEMNVAVTAEKFICTFINNIKYFNN